MNESIEGRIAVQINGIIGEAQRQSYYWQYNKHQGIEYIPPLFVNAELPVVPRIAKKYGGGHRGIYN
jgi:hypothetical protein